MQVSLSLEQESRLAEVAFREGLKPSDLATEVLAHYLEVDPDFVRAVEQGVASADRGDLVEHDEAARRIEEHFRV